MKSTRSMTDANAERQIAAAARRLGEAVQKVVLDAKLGKNAKKISSSSASSPQPQDQWKDTLLKILGSQQDKTDLDILLQNSHCDKFILRCMENELPPNLIHCMRLLRVLELKNAKEGELVKPISQEASEKVEKLLCLLCGDISVGEQLRPHLFGLLSLSGARYPFNAVHVAKAASNIIVALSKECFSPSLCFFLHERNMIIHMTDDVKELCGMSSSSLSTSQSNCLHGAEAETYGLWYYSLAAIVNMVKEASHCSCLELLTDFESAGGYHVLRFAIAKSTNENIQKMLQLVSKMLYCKITQDDEDTVTSGLEYSYSHTEFSTTDNSTMVSNPTAFEVIEDLMDHSIPLLSCYNAELGEGEKMHMNTNEDIQKLVDYSVDLSKQIAEMGYQDVDEDEDDLDRNIYGKEIVECTMQIYSDHPANFLIIEGEYNVLSKYLLSFPTFDKDDVKGVTLRLLEYVATGLPDADSSKPLFIASELFFCICKSILRLAFDDKSNAQKTISIFCKDADLLGETLEKLLQVDDSPLGQIMIDAGIMGDVLQEMMTLLMIAPTIKGGLSDEVKKQMDQVYCSMCRMLDLVVNTIVGLAQIPTSFSGSPLKNASLSQSKNRHVEVDAFLTIGMTELSLESCRAAAAAFETQLRYSESDAVFEDIGSLIRILNSIVHSIESASKEEHIRGKTENILAACLILDMMQRVLSDIESVQDAFRLQGGFEGLLRLLFCLEDKNRDIDKSGDTILSLVKSVYGVFDMATKVRISTATLKASRAVDLLGEQNDGYSKNREYITANGFYESLVTALGGVGLFDTPKHALAIMNLSLTLLHPSLIISLEEHEQDEISAKHINQLRNPDAAKLVLGLAISFPKERKFREISALALNVLIELSSPERAGTTLEQIANCGLCRTLISDDGFSFVFEDYDHPLYPRFVALLRRVASFKMGYMDFVALLRFIGHPLLGTDKDLSKKCALRLPIISSSFNAGDDKRFTRSKPSDEVERNIKLRLKTMSVIAGRCDRVARCYLGGTQDVKIFFTKQIQDNASLEDGLYNMAEQGVTRFIEIDKLQSRTKRPSTANTNDATNVDLWSPANVTGFSYSIWLRLPPEMKGSICIVDLSSNMRGSRDKRSFGKQQFLSIWYDLMSQCFNVISSASTKPISFPISSLSPDVWHHVLLTYQPPKRTTLLRKAVIGICVDGRPLESDVKLEGVALPPTSIMYIGIPNPMVALSGTIRGPLPYWEIGSFLLFSRILGPRDAVSIFSAGPDFHGQFWGDRPQRLSLSATATSLFSRLALNNDKGGLTGSLKKRSIPEIQGASYAMRDKMAPNMSSRRFDDFATLSSVGLFCNLSPEYIICAFHPSSSTTTMREDSIAATKGHFSKRLVNVAEIHSTNDLVSSDAIVYGEGSLVSPVSFGDNVQWLGGPNILLPILYASHNSSTIALTLRILRESSREHIPNLEMFHSGGGYAIIAHLLSNKTKIDSVILEHCFAFAVNGFDPEISDEYDGTGVHCGEKDSRGNYSWASSVDWSLVDLDAVKFLLKNHAVWNLKASGPDMALRAICLLNGLVSDKSCHGKFNARRLHLLEMTKWMIHLMIEVSTLFSLGAIGAEMTKDGSCDKVPKDAAYNKVITAYKQGWFAETLPASQVSVGGDPGIPVLLSSKTFLRKVLAHMLTPDDLIDIAGAIIYTMKKDSLHEDIAGHLGKDQINDKNFHQDDVLSIGSVCRIYLLRLLEELVVDGVNEISAKNNESYHGSSASSVNDLSNTSRETKRMFLSAFANVLSPIWFASVLEGCKDEPSASAAFRLMIVMLQNSPDFADAFGKYAGFAPFVLSIPRYSTSPNILVSMLSQLLHAPLLHLPCFGSLHPDQLCALFDTESDDPGLIMMENMKGGVERNTTSSDGIFSLLAECVGRNIQLGVADDEIGKKARESNEAIVTLLIHRHAFSSAFQRFCRTPAFLEPLAQSLCLMYNNDEDDDIDDSMINQEGEFYGWPSGKGPSKSNDSQEKHSEKSILIANSECLVRLLRQIINHAIFNGPKAVELVSALFQSFPIYSAAEEVEAFHMTLIEQCREIIEDALHRGSLVALANCVGVCSLLLNRLIRGFFTSGAIMSTFEAILMTLKQFSMPDTYAFRTLQKEDTDDIIRPNAAHIARLISTVALQRSKLCGPWDTIDERFQKTIVTGISSYLDFLLYALPVSSHKFTTRGSIDSSGRQEIKQFMLWQSCSIGRCEVYTLSNYPCLSEVKEPDRSFFIAVMAELLSLLYSKDQSLREEVALLIKSLLRQRHGIMSNLLIKDVTVANGAVKHVDLLTQGGFGSLLQIDLGVGGSKSEEVDIRLQTFFNWVDVNESDISHVFNLIGRDAVQTFPSIFTAEISSPEETINAEQKEMMVRLTTRNNAEKTINRREERANICDLSNERTEISQENWNRHGADDISSGSMRWKYLLRQLKGSRSIWEGGLTSNNRLVFSKEELMDKGRPNQNGASSDKKSDFKILHWKLDMSEGHERQRKKLMPNYEFNALYNIDVIVERRVGEEKYETEVEVVEPKASGNVEQLQEGTDLLFAADGFEATDFLKNMPKAAIKVENDDDNYEDDDDYEMNGTQEGKSENELDATMDTLKKMSMAAISNNADDIDDEDLSLEMEGDDYNDDGAEIMDEKIEAIDEEEVEVEPKRVKNEQITNLLHTGDLPEKVYNVQRCTGLEVCQALLAICRDSIYIIDGYEMSGKFGENGKITRVGKTMFTYNVNIRSKNFESISTEPSRNSKKKEESKSGYEKMLHQTNRKKMTFQDIFAVYRRRYQLQEIALEFYDIHSNGSFISFGSNAEREEVLNRLLNSSLPNSIFSSGSGSTPNYEKFMKALRTKITSQWVTGKMTNFDFLMHLNSFAGRSYNDLTQYPVFPWVIADYDSEELDLNNPNVYRDLSRPMGALGLARAEQFRERYDALDSNYSRGDEPPAFHYGTHYSCAAYVLNYLLRLEPFSRLALSLQGGKFDLADRLFNNVSSSWNSASRDNLQDVRELIPEFFFLPEFLENKNHFDLGAKQDGTHVDNVVLPPWAKGDPRRFVRLNRQVSM